MHQRPEKQLWSVVVSHIEGRNGDTQPGAELFDKFTVRTRFDLDKHGLPRYIVGDVSAPIPCGYKGAMWYAMVSATDAAQLDSPGRTSG